MRIKQTVNVRAAEDTAMEQTIFGKADGFATITHDDYDQVSGGTINIDASSNEDVPLRDVDTIAGVFISVDQNCTITLNGGAEAINIVKPASGNAQFFMNGPVTQINIATTTALTGLFCIWGSAS